MGRIRTIKPEFPHSESMGRVSRDARLLFIQLWTVVDDQGRSRAASRMLASLLYPYDSDAPKLIDKWMVELEAEKCIIRYSHEGKSYLQVLKWTDHQKIDKPSKPKIISPEDAETLARAREGSRPSPQAGEDPREGSSEEGTCTGTSTEDQGEDKEALVERVFEFFCKSLSKDSKRYTLTEDRKRKAVLRIEERLKIQDGNWIMVKAELKQAIENLAASDYHRTQGYTDWTEQIFRSQEEFEKRLNWQRPTGDGNGKLGNRKADNANTALARAQARVIAEAQGDGEAGLMLSGSGGGDGRDSPGKLLESSH